MLEGLLPRLLNVKVKERLIPFEGKQDLEKQMVRRMKGYLNPHARFIVLRDQDSTPDCRKVKFRLRELCAKANRSSISMVRIACRELEYFYLADLAAVESALSVSGLARRQNTARFRNPDRLESPSHELIKLTHGAYQKVSGSRQIGTRLAIDNARSSSFAALISAIRRMQQ